jgi:hypothetical protein
MTGEFELGPELVRMIREAMGPESLRAVIKKHREYVFHAAGDRIRLKISTANYDLDMLAFEPDGLKTLELSISPVLMARIVREYGEALERSGGPQVRRDFMKAFTDFVNAKNR